MRACDLVKLVSLAVFLRNGFIALLYLHTMHKISASCASYRVCECGARASLSLSLSLSLSSLSSLSPSLALSRPLSPSLALSLPAGAPAPLVWARAVSASGRALRVTCAAASAAPSALSSVRANLFALPANCSSDGIAPAAPLALLTPTHVPLHVASSIVPRQKKSVSRQEGMGVNSAREQRMQVRVDQEIWGEPPNHLNYFEYWYKYLIGA